MNQSLFLLFYGFAHRSVAFDELSVFVAVYLIWVVMAVIFFYLFKNDSRKAAVRDIMVVFGAAAAGYAIAVIVKNIFQSMRPFDVLTSVRSLIDESGYAFPSGHTTLLASFTGALWYGHRKAALWVGVATVLVGAARIIVGVHWPIDILGGLLIGLATGLVAQRIAKRVLPPR